MTSIDTPPSATEPDVDVPAAPPGVPALEQPAVVVLRHKRSAIDIIGPVVTFGLFIGFWYFMSYWGLQHLFHKPQFLITPPHEVIDKSFFDATTRSALFAALWLSMRVAFIGLFIAIVIGMTEAIIMSQARWIERSFWPYMVALQAVPILAFVPLIGTIWGFNFKARVIVCVVIALFPIVANTLFGLLSADRAQHDLFTLHGASRYTRLRKLQLPAAMPAIFTGLRISAGLSVIGAVVGDFFFRQGAPGIGILIDNYRSRLNNPAMYGAVILAALLGIVVFMLFGWLGNKVVGHWHESARDSR
jgi:NitT/TauT family transport system permease protein